MRYRYHREAGLELTEASLYYEARKSGLGDQFLDEVDATADRILDAPDRWSLLGDGVRRCSLRRFPYALLYRRLTDDLIEIVAVMHLHRGPDYWKGRIG